MLKRVDLEGLGRDEINTADLPLAIMADRSDGGQREIEYEDDCEDPLGNRYTRRLKIHSTGKIGLATPFDEHLLVILVSLHKAKTNYADRQFTTQAKEVLSILGWNYSGKSYNRLKQSLEVWTSLYIKMEMAWFDKRIGRPVSQGFHIMDEYKEDGEVIRIKWGETFFASLSAGHIAAIDLTLFFSLGSAVSRRLYRVLNARMSDGHTSHEFDLDSLAHFNLGLARAKDMAQTKRRLRPAIEELERIGFLKAVPEAKRFRKVRPGVWSVLFELAGEPARVEETPAVVLALIEQGITACVAHDLARQHTEEEIMRQIESLKWRLRKKIKTFSPSGWLLKAIRQSFPVPEGFRKEAERQQVISFERTAKQGPEPADVYWNGLTPEQQAAVDEEALRNASPERLQEREHADRRKRKLVDLMIRQEYVEKLVAEAVSSSPIPQEKP